MVEIRFAKEVDLKDLYRWPFKWLKCAPVAALIKNAYDWATNHNNEVRGSFRGK